VLVLWPRDAAADSPLQAVRFARATGRWSARTIAWTERAAAGAPARPWTACRSGLALGRFPGGFLLRAHMNPSAECTVLLSPDLAVRAVLAGWPVATFADGRLVYQRNQVHFAPVHPVALALFDLRGGETALYPPRPPCGLRLARIERNRALFTESWCRAHDHPCDPEALEESVVSDVATDAAGDALAFVTAWDNTAGWSDTERWGRLEPFREVRAALGGWDGESPPPDALFRGLAAGLARTRTLGREADVRAALDFEARFGPGLPERALEPAVGRALFRSGTN
jgi:hypothetical protein